MAHPIQSQPCTCRRIHIIPVGDMDLHAGQATCWCYPLELHPGLFVHNAKDCREARERAGHVGCSPGWIQIAEVVASPSILFTGLRHHLS